MALKGDGKRARLENVTILSTCPFSSRGAGLPHGGTPHPSLPHHVSRQPGGERVGRHEVEGNAGVRKTGPLLCGEGG